MKPKLLRLVLPFVAVASVAESGAGGLKTKERAGLTREVIVDLTARDEALLEDMGLAHGSRSSASFTLDEKLLSRYGGDLLSTTVRVRSTKLGEELAPLFLAARRKEGTVEIIPGPSLIGKAWSSVAVLQLGLDGKLPATSARWRGALAAAIEKHPERYEAALLRTGILVFGHPEYGNQIGTGLLLGDDRVLTNLHVVAPYLDQGMLGTIHFVPACESGPGGVTCGERLRKAVRLKEVVETAGCAPAGTPAPAVAGDCAVLALEERVAVKDDRAWVYSDLGAREVRARPLLLLSVPTRALPPCNASSECAQYNRCVESVQMLRMLDVSSAVARGRERALTASFSPALTACPAQELATRGCGPGAERCACRAADLAGALCYLGGTMPGSSGGAVLDLEDLRLIGLHAGGDRRGYSFNFGLPLPAGVR